ncbi:hypothetical protein Q8W71_08870 [Methylobacterium sp. NEAU 140]|nr:DUF6883 domain-containing protein [Methylobacterium sp. NEAU 140]MDP4022733.1 hypothetical protein [Methylobacterium sp. NEAU 140]
MRFGFAASQPERLADALSRHFAEAPHTRTTIDAVGATRIICEGPLHGLDGRAPTIRSVWLIEPDRYARLLTIVPRPRGVGRT